MKISFKYNHTFKFQAFSSAECNTNGPINLSWIAGAKKNTQ